jgi:hypothetical protein
MATAIVPASAMADDPPPPPAPAEQPAQPPADQPAEQPPPAPADQPPPAPAKPSCLQPKGQIQDMAIRGVRVGMRAKVREADGRPAQVTSVSYCVDGGGDFSFALSPDSDVALVLSTAPGDSIGGINPTSPAESARMEFPRMKRLAKMGGTILYRVDQRRQLILGVAVGRVSFVGAADRLLLEYPGKLGYYVRRLGFY